MNRLFFANIEERIRMWLAEDLPAGDLTGMALFSGQEFRGAVVAREELVAAGVTGVAPLVFAVADPGIRCRPLVRDGDAVKPGAALLEVQGPAASVLAAERLALNLLMRMCAVATRTAAFCAEVRGTGSRITDTRKTTPGMRDLEKYAVRCGGGVNHRFCLSDGVLIKDNHIAACGSLAAAVERARKRAPHTVRIEVECDTLDQVEEALAAGADIIMLDNMDTSAIRAGVELVRGRAITEASGSMTLERVREVALTGVDFISVGSLTHAAGSVDIGLDAAD